MDFASARYHSKGKVGKGDLWMFRCKNRERKGIKCNGWVKVCYKLVGDKPEFDITKDLVRTRPHDKGCEYFKTNRTLAKQPTCQHRSPTERTEDSLASESTGQPEEDSSQASDAAEDDLDYGDFSSIDSEVDSVMCKLDDISQALDRGSVDEQERLALRRKVEKCQGKFEMLLNNLSTDSYDKEPSDSLDAGQTALTNLSVNLYSKLYESLLVNLFSAGNRSFLNSSSAPSSACDSPADPKTASTKESAHDCGSLSDGDSSKPKQNSSDDESVSDLRGFTLAFEDDYKQLMNEQLLSGAPFGSADEPNRTKRPNSSSDDTDAPNKKLKALQV